MDNKKRGLLSRFMERASPTVEPAEFAPDILRIQETPPRPMPRVVLSIGLALLGAALVWAIFGRLDIVAVAQGKLVPKTYLKIVQPPEAGIVREILVNQGERVEAGQVLMRMDTTLATADLKAIRAEYEQNLITLRRIDAELAGDEFERHPGDPPRLFREVLAQYHSNRQVLEASLAEERAAYEQARHELSAAREVKQKLDKILPLYQEQEETYARLAEQGYVGRLVAAEKVRERIEKEEEAKTQAHLIASEKAAMLQSERRMAQIRSDYMKRLRDERSEAALRAERLEQDLAKQGHRQSLLELKAPQDGLVKSLATHTIGTVTQPGTILMTLVPEAEPLLAEVWLSNSDVGFIRPGQEVKVKFETFRFQKYGMLDGVVWHVAADAEDSQERTQGSAPGQLVYRTLIELASQYLENDNITYDLVPGMQVTAEVKLGDRSALEYLLSPVRKAFHEAGRER